MLRAAANKQFPGQVTSEEDVTEISSDESTAGDSDSNNNNQEDADIESLKFHKRRLEQQLKTSSANKKHDIQHTISSIQTEIDSLEQKKLAKPKQANTTPAVIAEAKTPNILTNTWMTNDGSATIEQAGGNMISSSKANLQPATSNTTNSPDNHVAAPKLVYADSNPSTGPSLNSASATNTNSPAVNTATIRHSITPIVTAYTSNEAISEIDSPIPESPQDDLEMDNLTDKDDTVAIGSKKLGLKPKEMITKNHLAPKPNDSELVKRAKEDLDIYLTTFSTKKRVNTEIKALRKKLAQYIKEKLTIVAEDNYDAALIAVYQKVERELRKKSWFNHKLSKSTLYDIVNRTLADLKSNAIKPANNVNHPVNGAIRYDIEVKSVFLNDDSTNNDSALMKQVKADIEEYLAYLADHDIKNDNIMRLRVKITKMLDDALAGARRAKYDLNIVNIYRNIEGLFNQEWWFQRNKSKLRQIVKCTMSQINNSTLIPRTEEWAKLFDTIEAQEKEREKERAKEREQATIENANLKDEITGLKTEMQKMTQMMQQFILNQKSNSNTDSTVKQSATPGSPTISATATQLTVTPKSDSEQQQENNLFIANLIKNNSLTHTMFFERAVGIEDLADEKSFYADAKTCEMNSLQRQVILLHQLHYKAISYELIKDEEYNNHILECKEGRILLPEINLNSGSSPEIPEASKNQIIRVLKKYCQTNTKPLFICFHKGNHFTLLAVQKNKEGLQYRYIDSLHDFVHKQQNADTLLKDNLAGVLGNVCKEVKEIAIPYKKQQSLSNGIHYNECGLHVILATIFLLKTNLSADLATMRGNISIPGNNSSGNGGLDPKDALLVMMGYRNLCKDLNSQLHQIKPKSATRSKTIIRNQQEYTIFNKSGKAAKNLDKPAVADQGKGLSSSI